MIESCRKVKISTYMATIFKVKHRKSSFIPIFSRAQQFVRKIAIDDKTCINFQKLLSRFTLDFFSTFYSYSILQYISMLQIPFNGKVVSNCSSGIMRGYLAEGINLTLRKDNAIYLSYFAFKITYLSEMKIKETSNVLSLLPFWTLGYVPSCHLNS